jgi:hypothetical protein
MTDEVTWTDPETWQVRHEIKKSIRVKSKYFMNTTDMSYYDGVIQFPRYHKENKGVCGKIELMSPDDYIQSCALSRSRPNTVDEEMMNVNMTRVIVLEQKMRAGEKLPLIVIDKKSCMQEGRHRALASKRIGLEKIPVLVVTDC